MSDVSDALLQRDGSAVGRPGIRAASWAKKFASFSEISGGLTFEHKVSGQLRANDRAYVSMSLASLLALQARMQVSPPMSFGASDHRSIVLRFGEPEGEPFRSPTWPYSHPSWANTLLGIMSGWEPSGRWTNDLKDIEAAVEGAKCELLHLRELVTEPPSVVHAISLAALRAVIKGDVEQARRSCKALGLDPAASARRLRSMLESKVSHTYVSLLSSSVSGYVPEEAHPKQAWFKRLWLAWRQKKLVSPASVWTSDDDVIANSSAQARALSTYWAPVFQGDATEEQTQEELDAWIPRFPLGDLSVEPCDFKEALLSAAFTSPGLDGRSYSAYVPIASQVSVVLSEIFADLARGCSLPLSWTESALVFLPKADGPLLKPHEWRPISLLNCMSKVFARALAFKLMSRVAPHLHPSQCGFVPGKGTHFAFMNIEESALALGSQAPQSSLLLLDIAQAFPTLSRRWLKRVLERVGCPPWLMHFFNEVLRPSRSYIVWQHRLHGFLLVDTGVPQGHPLASLLFVMGIDPWVRRLAASLTAPSALALFADDLSVTHMCIADLAQLEGHLADAERAMGLRVHWPKTQIIPLGPSLAEWQASFEAIFPHDHPFRSISVVSQARLLGFWVGRGSDLALERCSLEKMRGRLLQIKDLRGGVAMNRVFLNAVLFSCATHALRVITPLASFAQFWAWLQDDLHTSPRKWFRPYQAQAKHIFGLPGAQYDFAQVRDALLFKMLQAIGDVFWNKSRILDSWYLDDEALLLHPLEGWRRRGCLATWRAAWERAYDMGAVIRTSPSSYRWRDWCEVLRRLRGGGAERDRVRKLVRNHLVERCASLPERWRALIRAGLVEQAARRLAVRTPSACVALLRFFLGGVPQTSRRPHLGDCCWCLRWHMHERWLTKLWGGCYKPRLHNEQGFRWLWSMPKNAVFELMLNSGQRDCLRHLAALLRVLINTIWATVHQKGPGPAPTLQTMARRLRLR